MLYIIYKKLLATPRKKQNDPLGVATPRLKTTNLNRPRASYYKQLNSKFCRFIIYN